MCRWGDFYNVFLCSLSFRCSFVEICFQLLMHLKCFAGRAVSWKQQLQCAGEPWSATVSSFLVFILDNHPWCPASNDQHSHKQVISLSPCSPFPCISKGNYFYGIALRLKHQMPLAARHLRKVSLNHDFRHLRKVRFKHDLNKSSTMIALWFTPVAGLLCFVLEYGTVAPSIAKWLPYTHIPRWIAALLLDTLKMWPAICLTCRHWKQQERKVILSRMRSGWVLKKGMPLCTIFDVHLVKVDFKNWGRAYSQMVSLCISGKMGSLNRDLFWECGERLLQCASSTKPWRTA